MALITIYHRFADGLIPAGLITAVRLNTNWDRLYTLVNGELDNDNMASGYHLVSTVATKPTWTSAYTGHILYCTDTGKLWFGDSSAFQEITPSHAMLSTSHSDSVAASVTQGALVYGNATPAWAKLSGDNSGAKKFLVMTSLVPSWGNIIFSDLPSVALDAWSETSANTLLNATTVKHGLCPAGNDNEYTFLNGKLAWSSATTGQMVADATPLVVIENNTERNNSGAPYDRIKKIIINESVTGSVLLKFSYATTSAPTEAFFRVYHNETIVSDVFTDTTGDYITDEEVTITGPFVATDTIEIRSSGPAKAKDMSLNYSWKLLSILGLTLVTPLDITDTTKISTTNSDTA
jgi:hypothetical protein